MCVVNAHRPVVRKIVPGHCGKEIEFDRKGRGCCHDIQEHDIVCHTNASQNDTPIPYCAAKSSVHDVAHATIV